MLMILLGRKGIEPSMAYSHWVYSSTRKPTNGPFLIYLSFSGIEPVGKNTYIPLKIICYFNIFFLRVIHPVQFPLHEPYFDLTPIKVMHTKIKPTYLYTWLYILIRKLIKLIAHTPFSAWRVVST